MKKIFLTGFLSALTAFAGLTANASDVINTDEAPQYTDGVQVQSSGRPTREIPAPGIFPKGSRIAWYCAFDFKGRAQGLQIILGHFETRGEGTLRCSDAIGGKYEQPIQVTIDSSPLALNVALGRFDFVGYTGKISFLAKSPEQIYGDYFVTQARAAAFFGTGIFSATRADTASVTFDLNLEVSKGFGVQAGINLMTIEPLAQMVQVPEFSGK